MNNTSKKLDFYKSKALIVFGLAVLLIVSVLVPLSIIKAETVDDAEWYVTLNFNETGGKFCDLIFGEAIDASNGPPNDDFDRPFPPAGPERSIDAIFNDNLDVPYNRLKWDFRHFSSENTYSVWNLTINWVNGTGGGTTINITWDETEFDNCEYDSVILWDSDANLVLSEMITENSYEFDCDSEYNYNFKIITTTTNNPPINPYDPNPDNGAPDVSITTDLGWSGGDIDPTDPVKYNISFGESSPPPQVSTNQSGESYDPGELAYSTLYYWKIVSIDSQGNSVEGPVWSFTTEAEPNPDPGDGDGDGGDNGGDSGDDGGSSGPPPNLAPIANASNSETSGLVGTYIRFDGTNSYDQDEDGYIFKWEWDFDDGETGEGNITEHIFFDEGVFNVVLTVTDNNGAKDTDTVNVTITKANNPPENLTVTGPTVGNKNVSYDYLVNATDIDNDTLSYIFNWGDEQSTASEFYPIDAIVTLNHTWIAAGKYKIEVQAYDSQTYSRTTEITILIDAINIGDIGYFTDDDGDGIYDSFINETSGQKTTLEQDKEGNYLIDTDGDDKWNLQYNTETEEISDYKKESKEGEIATLIIIAIILILIGCGIFYYFIYTKKPKKPKQTKKPVKKTDKKQTPKKKSGKK